MFNGNFIIKSSRKNPQSNTFVIVGMCTRKQTQKTHATNFKNFIRR